MATLASLVVNLEANTAAYQRDMKRSNKAIDALKKRALALGGTLAAAFTVRSLTRFTSDSVRAFTVQQDAVEGLRAALIATGKEGEGVLQRLTQRASELQQQTRKGDEEIIGALTTVTQLAKGLDVSALEDVQTAIIGIAETFTGGNLDSAAQLIGKSIGSTTNALTRYGIQLDAGATAQEKLAQIMEQSSTFFDVAKARADTLAGRLSQLSNAWGDLKEAIGGVVAGSPLVKAFLEETTKVISNITTVIQAGGPFVKEGFAILGDIAGQAFVAAFETSFAKIGEREILGVPVFGKVFTGPAREAADEAVAVIRDRLADLGELAGRAAAQTSVLAESLAGTGGGGAGSLAGSLQTAKEAAVEAHKSLKDTLPTLEQRMQSALKANAAQLRVMGNAFEQEFKLRLPESLRDGLNFAAGVIPPAIDEMRETIKEKAIQVGESFIRGLVSGTQNLKEMLRRAIDDIASTILIGGIKDLLKISSPSKVAMEIGQQYAEGLALGVGAGRGTVAMAGRSTAAGLVSAPQGGNRTGPMIGELKVEMSVAAIDARGVHEMLFSNRGAIAESFVTALNENASLRALMRQL